MYKTIHRQSQADKQKNGFKCRTQTYNHWTVGTCFYINIPINHGRQICGPQREPQRYGLVARRELDQKEHDDITSHVMQTAKKTKPPEFYSIIHQIWKNYNDPARSFCYIERRRLQQPVEIDKDIV
ncbi:hypothetical protein HELRODRAFT_171515 [Helobdella robusta]|uniref:Uncharacterized protein n=1 Tax=Helobdella robusta TaxID=6412 RepID=T1F4D1_HELRO|nr:hypothetical protein HELRODRAFT_171515 [Helobdella robusta]ESO05175.1 hypothetical protein HELRODRAFT_171515 [Helobdella robusta]